MYSTLSDTPPLQKEYTLGPGDVLDVDVYQVEELKRTVRINSSGTIKFPPAGNITVSGLTVTEAENKIEKGLSKYLKNPQVTIFVKEYESQRVTILGAVKEPMLYVLKEQKYLLDIISAAGGIEKEAGDICYVQRGKETLVIDLNRLLYNGDVRFNIPVFSGDVINIPDGGVVFVDGSVNKPGAYPVQGSVTLSRAIAMAGGLKYEAAQGDILVFSPNVQGTHTVYEANYDDIIENIENDIVLKNKDIVIVPESGMKNFLAKFMGSIRFFIRFGDVDTGFGY